MNPAELTMTISLIGLAISSLAATVTTIVASLTED